MLLFSSADFFQKFFQEHYQSAQQFGSRSGLTEHSVCPDLGPNCLQGYQQAMKTAASKEKVKTPTRTVAGRGQVCFWLLFDLDFILVGGGYLFCYLTILTTIHNE